MSIEDLERLVPLNISIALPKSNFNSKYYYYYCYLFSCYSLYFGLFKPLPLKINQMFVYEPSLLRPLLATYLLLVHHSDHTVLMPKLILLYVLFNILLQLILHGSANELNLMFYTCKFKIN